MQTIKTIVISVTVVFIFSQEGFSQVGGTAVFNFLNLPYTSKVAALGGTSVAVPGDDAGLVFQNPSLLKPENHNIATFSYNHYYAGINQTFFSFTRDYGKYGSFAAGIFHVGYGSFTQTDEYGNSDGNFTAGETALNIAWSYPIDSMFQFGVTLKPIIANYENYASSAIAADAGITYFNPHQLLAVSLVLKNAGYQLKPFYGTSRENLPFEVQAGISKKLLHAPFRFSMAVRHIEMPDLNYRKTEQPGLPDETSGQAGKFAGTGLFDGIMRHIILGVEFVPVKTFSVNLGYNYQRRQQMMVEELKGSTGFSWGMALNLKKMSLSYSNSKYHIAGSTHQFSFSINLNTLIKKQVARTTEV